MNLTFLLFMLLAPQRVHVTDALVTPPEVLYYADAFYTRAARDNRIEGAVTIEGAFDANGCMKVLRTVKGLGYGLDANALAAVSSWRFAPARRDGTAVAAIAQIDIEFSLAGPIPVEYDDMNRVGPGVSAPTVINRVQPHYTQEAGEARLVGTVVLQAIVRTDGTTRILKVLKPLPLGLTESAVEALQQWRFKPAVRNGQDVPVSVNIEIGFNLEQNNGEVNPCR